MKILTQKQISSFRDFVSAHENFIIAGHKDPDGDCISSALVANEILKSFGKNNFLLNTGPFKRTEIREYEKLFSNSLPFMNRLERKDWGLLIADCSELSRLGDVGADLKGFDTFVIDHHKTSEGANLDNDAKGIIDSSSPAAVCLMQMLYENTVGVPNAALAELMFFGLCTDTGFFRFLHSDSAKVFALVARLVKCGANPAKIYERISSGKSWESRKLLGALLYRAQLYCKGRLAIACETIEDTRAWGKEGRDSDALYSALLSAKGVEVAVFLRQESQNSCTAGFRSRGDIDVSCVAAKFGGGGHKNASGVCVEGKMENLLSQIVKEFERIFKREKLSPIKGAP